VGPARASRTRLAWITWAGDALVHCRRRIDDAARTVGPLGPCTRIAEGAPPARVPAPSSHPPDVTFADATPDSACALTIEDAQLVPAPKPARLTLTTPSGKIDLDTWTPDTEGDAFHIEASFSPDHRRVAILRVAVGLGEGERIVDVVSAQVRAAPACR
jgi:hypothetical protein